SAYRYVEVFKGANALRYGSNSLGGAVNFVTPTGRDADAFESRVDAGSFGYIRAQASSGGASGPWDWFITTSAERQDGYREHSEGQTERLNANLGYQLSPDAETRFYVNANSWRAHLPGEVSKAAALDSPRSANPEFVQLDEQRNIDSVRIANKTTLRFGPTTVDFGVFTHLRDVDHPIYRYLDYNVTDYGGFARATDNRMIGDFRNQLVVGFTSLDGTTDYREYANLGNAVRGPLLTSQLWTSQNHSVYGENSFYFLSNVAFVAGGQYMYAVRDQNDRILSDGDQSGGRTYSLFSPKAGLLWNVDASWQVFGNISRSAEVPTFDANTFATPASSNLNAQTATTYEIGTRGRTSDMKWDVSLYRADIRDELQCLTTSPYSLCTVVNADRTVHQGLEAGFSIAFLKSVYAKGDSFWFNVDYTLSDFFFDDDPVHGNNRLPGAPPHYVRAEVLYRQPNGFYIGPNVEWVPRSYYADNANNVTVDPFELSNFRIGIERDRGWSAYLEGRNLFDKHYISAVLTADTATANSEIFSPGDGRAIYGGMQYKW
ncbi:MAG: TonB-dependent receptor, partial [Proteobacteria bacterium]|nr:TonB-dependent receptor [Pseudomonadota bacterium]